MPARSEPLLWVQLIGAGLFPLEALLLLLLLAGSDPGPVPALERLLCWSLGVLAPALLLWRRPADVWSLLLLQTPLRGRRSLQQRLSRLQEALPPRLGLVLGAVLSLPLLWWLDDHAALAGSITPLEGSPRLVLLVLAAVLLAVMLWQWQQLLQALWLLSREPAAVEAAAPMTVAELEESRTCLGLPLLLLDPLRLDSPAVPARRPPDSPATAPASPAVDAELPGDHPTSLTPPARRVEAAAPSPDRESATSSAASDGGLPEENTSHEQGAGVGDPAGLEEAPDPAPMPDGSGASDPSGASTAAEGDGAAPAASESVDAWVDGEAPADDPPG
jgi:hypothetical protein